MKKFAARKNIFLIAGALVAFLCVALAAGIFLRHQHRPPARADTSPFETEMIEALVRGILHEYGVRGAPVCFLAFGENRTPPGAQFIARFANCRQPAVCSLGSAVAPPISRYIEKSTGRPGLIVQIVSFREYIPGTFDVTVSISNLPPGHDRIIYRISKTPGEWTISQRTTL